MTLSYAGASGTTYAASATAPTGVGSYTVTAAVAADANYVSASSVATAFTITPRPITVTAAAKTKVYGNSDPILTYTVSGTLAGSDQLTGALSRTAGETVAVRLTAWPKRDGLGVAERVVVVFDLVAVAPNLARKISTAPALTNVGRGSTGDGAID